LSVLPGVADETTLHRDEKEDVIVSRHLGPGGITVITSASAPWRRGYAAGIGGL
jgi:hypothetical protein